MSDQHNSESWPRVLRETTLAGLELGNRAVVAPMSRVSATREGIPTSRMARYYRSFAEGGFGLVLSEGTFTGDPASRAYANQPGLVTDSQVRGWHAVVEAVHGAGVPIIAQLMHAGALSQVLGETVAPSEVAPLGAKMPSYGGSGPFPVPRAMGDSDLASAVAGFTRSAELAIRAGFDGVEIHGANGYLIDQFVTDYTNKRSDHYGGNTAERTRFACEVLRAVRGAIGPRAPLGIRLSQGKVNDADHRWPGRGEDARDIFTAVARAGTDFVHVASEGSDWADGAAACGEESITRIAREVTGLPVIANGGLHEPEQAETVLRDGHADLVSLGRGALADPDWPRRLRAGHELTPFDSGMLTPMATLRNADSWALRGAGRENGAYRAAP